MEDLQESQENEKETRQSKNIPNVTDKLEALTLKTEDDQDPNPEAPESEEEKVHMMTSTVGHDEVQHEDPKQLTEVIKSGVDLNEPLSSVDGRGPLHAAATEGDVTHDEVQHEDSQQLTEVHMMTSTVGHDEVTHEDPQHEQLTEVIKPGVDLNEPLSSVDGRGPLHAAAAEGDVSVVQTLLDQGVNVDMPDCHGNTPSHYAARGGHIVVLQLLIDRGANGAIMNDKGRTVLEDAVYSDSADIVKLLLSKWSCRCYAGSASILHSSIVCGNVEIIKQILENIGDVNTQELPDMKTPLIVATENASRPVVEALLKSGADVSLRDGMGNTAMYYALLCKDPIPMAKLLIEWGVSVNAACTEVKRTEEADAVDETCENTKQTPLHVAARLHNSALIQFLLQHEADVNVRDHNGNVPFYTLFQEDLTESDDDVVSCANMLLEALNSMIKEWLIASIQDQEEVDSTTLLLSSAFRGDIGFVNILLLNGEDIDVVSELGFTPLQLALYRGNFEMASYLIDKGANVNIRDAYSLLPLQVAVILGNISLVNKILSKTCQTLLNSLPIPLIQLAGYCGQPEMIVFVLNNCPM